MEQTPEQQQWVAQMAAEIQTAHQNAELAFAGGDTALSTQWSNQAQEYQKVLSQFLIQGQPIVAIKATKPKSFPIPIPLLVIGVFIALAVFFATRPPPNLANKPLIVSNAKFVAPSFYTLKTKDDGPITVTQAESTALFPGLTLPTDDTVLPLPAPVTIMCTMFTPTMVGTETIPVGSGCTAATS